MTLVDSAELTSHVTASYLERGSLRFEVREDLGGVGPLEQSVVESLSFDPRGVSGLDSHRFLVWGEARGGVWTVELWRVVPETGAPVLTRESSRGVPVGSSISTPPVELRIVGGTYLPPDQRLLPNVEREVLLLATDLVEVQAACVDPDDRFVLWVLHHDDGTRSLERLELQGLARTQLVTDTDVPFLRDTHSLRALRDGVELRQYYAETGGEAPQGSDYGVVLHDADNDGVIEGLDALDQQAFQSLPAYWSPVEDFVRY